jgi:hypothetical protein
VKINPNNQLMLTGFCLKYCTNALSYKYKIYKLWKIKNTDIDIQEKWYPFSSEFQNGSNLYTGENSTELTAFQTLFKSDNLTFVWKFEFEVESVSLYNGVSTGISSLIVFINQVPNNGSCTIFPLNGTAVSTIFTISCANWYDPDGEIVKYTYFGNYMGDQMKLGLGWSSDGIISTQLPQGALYDSYRLYISVEITDSDDGKAYYSVPVFVTVVADTVSVPNLMSELISLSYSANPNRILFEAQTQNSIQLILTIASVLNGQSLADKSGLILSSNTSSSNLFSQTYGPLSSYSGVASSLGINDAQFEANKNSRSQTRDSLVSFVNNISISDMDSARAQVSMLSVLTNQPDEITRKSADSVTNQCIRLVLALDYFSTQSFKDEMKQMVVGLVSTMGNINSGLSIAFNRRESVLNADASDAIALPIYSYDTDIENFWTNPNNFISDTQTGIDHNMNTQRQKFAVADNNQKTRSIIDVSTRVLSEQFSINELYNIETPSLIVRFSKLNAYNLPSTLELESGTFQIPSFCNLTGQTNETKCINQVLTMKAQSEPMATNGHNGENETNVGTSSAVDLGFYNSNGAPLSIKHSLSPIDIWIKRDVSAINIDFQYVNATSLNVSSRLQFLPNCINISSSNASIHIHIKPTNITSVGYLVLVKLGYTPILNSSYADFDFMKIFCPQSGNKNLIVLIE